MEQGMVRIRKAVLGGAVALAAISIAGLYGVERPPVPAGTGAKAAAPQGGPPAMPVPVAKVVKRTVPIYLEYSARTESIRNVSLQAKIAGYINAQPAADGADVKQGDLLYKIDDRDYRAALDGAKAQAQRDGAALDYARSTYKRGDELARSGYLARDTFDQRASNVAQSEAALAMDQAAIRTAENNVGYTEIRAPFSGRLGRDRAPVGTLVGSAGTTLNTLVQLDPIYVTFNPSETDLTGIQKARAGGKAKADVLLSDEADARHSGEVTFIDNAVDRATGTITVRATIANANFGLLPGQYVRVRLHVRDEPDVLMVPQTALGSSQLGKYVYVVGAESKADQRLVTLGPSSGELVGVKGLSEQDQVIVGNLQKIGPGAPVQPLSPKQASGL
jgi:multidrug efflux system membrane fusion protein